MNHGDLWRQLIARQPPPIQSILPDTIPVPVFGNPFTSRIATIGINPSHAEYDTRGKRLVGAQQRLPSPSQANSASPAELTDDGVAQMVDGLTGYFDNRPYHWFNKLRRLLESAFGVTYGDGACHLDIVHWATRPIWGDLPPGDRAALLHDSSAHLAALLAAMDLHVVLCNGRQVIDQVIASGLAPLHQVGPVRLGTRTYRMYAADHAGVSWVGWTANLQTNWVANTLIEHDLAGAVRRVVGA